MARAHIELPAGWGPGRAIIAAVTAQGYDCQEHRFLGTGERILVLCPPASERTKRL